MILVVEGERGVREQLERLIVSLKHDCITCGSMGDALRGIVAQQSIEIVILSTESPEIDGIAFCKELAEATNYRPYVAPIITTSCLNTEAIVGCMRAGAVGFLEQPLSVEVVRRELEALLSLVRRKRIRDVPRAHLDVSLDSKHSPENVNHSEFEPQFRPQIDARHFLKWRAQFRRKFAPLQWKEAYWDIMLDLLTAEEDGVQSTLLSSYAAAQVPPSSASRYIKNLADAGIVELWQDKADKRRTNIKLSEHARSIIYEQMARLVRK